MITGETTLNIRKITSKVILRLYRALISLCVTIIISGFLVMLFLVTARLSWNIDWHKDFLPCAIKGVYADPGLNETETMVAVHALKLVDPVVLQSVVNDGAKIYLVKEGGPFSEREDGREVWGLATLPKAIYSRKLNLIALYLPGKVEARADLSGIECRQTVIHEVGHYVDFLYKGGMLKTGEECGASSTPEWAKIHADESERIGTMTELAGLNVYSLSESFATAFALYWLYPERFRNECPEAATYMDHVVATFQRG